MTDEHVHDEQLLQRLGAALVAVAAPTAPPPAALQDLHRVIDSSRAADAVPARRRPRALTVSVAGALAAAFIAIVAVATSMPRWSRETATRVAVVTTSPAFGAVVERQRLLDTALDDGDADRVLIESVRLRFALANLSSGELAPIREDIEALLDRADTFLRQHRTGGNDAPAISPQDTSTTEPAETTATTHPRTSATGRATGQAITVPDDDIDGDDGDGDDGDDNDMIDDDNSGPGGGGDAVEIDDDNSGPGGGGGDPDPDDPDDDSGPGTD
jgi:hypothetical protein